MIVDWFNYEDKTEETFTIKDSTIELCTIFGTRIIEGFKWDVSIIIVMGVLFYEKMWLDEISQDQPIQTEILHDNLPYNNNKLLCMYELKTLMLKPCLISSLKTLRVSFIFNVQIIVYHLFHPWIKKTNVHMARKTIIDAVSSVMIFLCKRCFKYKSWDPTIDGNYRVITLFLPW